MWLAEQERSRDLLVVNSENNTKQYTGQKKLHAIINVENTTTEDVQLNTELINHIHLLFSIGMRKTKLGGRL